MSLCPDVGQGADGVVADGQDSRSWVTSSDHKRKAGRAKGSGQPPHQGQLPWVGRQVQGIQAGIRIVSRPAPWINC